MLLTIVEVAVKTVTLPNLLLIWSGLFLSKGTHV